ncbi:MAG: tetratricopeptide repeat protein [Pirellulales bacterium]
MRIQTTALALLIICGTAASLPAADIARVRGGTSAINGELTEMSPTEIVIKGRNDKEEKIAVNELESLKFDGEPSQLNGVRTALNTGRNDDAVKALDRIDAKSVERDEIKAEIEYYRALATARLALAGTGSVTDAGKLMLAFIKDHAKSFHYFEANETIGDLLVASGKYSDAEKYYDTVEQNAPWPDYKIRAGVAKGRTLLKQAKGDEAMAVFAGLQKQADGQTGDLVARQKLMASEGLAEAQILSGKTEEGIKLLDSLIAEADPEHAEVHALAYNALGNAHRKAGRKKEARMAFLHTHLLYSNFSDLHAESLANLAELFKELGDAERSGDMQDTLTQRYGNSKWAKK